MWQRIRHMLRKEFIQAFRDPRSRFAILVPPVTEMLLFGYAVTTDVRNVATAVYDLDNSRASREVVARFVGSGYFQIVEYVSTESRAQELMDRGKAQVILQIQRGFQERWQTGRTARLQLILDGTDSNTASIVSGYSAKIAEQLSQEALDSRMLRLQGSLPRTGRVALETRAWFNENLESRNFYVPAVIAMIVMLSSLMLTSMAIVREKEIGTIEQMLVTPIRPIEFILGKTVPFALISFADVVLVTAVGVLWFGVPVRGSLWVLLLATSVFLMTTLGLGLLLSTISQTQQQVMMSSIFFFMPAVLLSGMVFPIANMPVVVQWLTLLNPLRYFLVIIRALFLKGVGLAILWPQLLALLLMGAATLWLASKRFRKTIV